VDAHVLEAYATAAGVIVSIAGVIVSMGIFAIQAYRGRFRTSIDLALRLGDQFDSPGFEKKRCEAASALSTNKNLDEAEPIYDILDTLGFLVRKKAIDKEIAWSVFYYSVQGYWSNGKAHIEAKRQNDKDETLWVDFERLHAVLLKIQRHRANKSEPDVLGQKEKEQFLDDEKSLYKRVIASKRGPVRRDEIAATAEGLTALHHQKSGRARARIHGRGKRTAQGFRVGDEPRKRKPPPDPPGERGLSPSVLQHVIEVTGRDHGMEVSFQG
jgi:hypothetical protein